MLPVRCYTCGKVLGHLQKEWENYRQNSPEEWSEFFKTFQIKRYCCRRVIMAQVPDYNQEKQHTLPTSVSLAPESDKVIRFYLAR
jgi:DNA-directed RNA polymerase subunit N (RpoN/RPB10)